jgi:hypothetical protein
VGEIEGSNDNVDGNNITSPKVRWFFFSLVGFSKSQLYDWDLIYLLNFR